MSKIILIASMALLFAGQVSANTRDDINNCRGAKCPDVQLLNKMEQMAQSRGNTSFKSQAYAQKLRQECNKFPAYSWVGQRGRTRSFNDAIFRADLINYQKCSGIVMLQAMKAAFGKRAKKPTNSCTCESSHYSKQDYDFKLKTKEGRILKSFAGAEQDGGKADRRKCQAAKNSNEYRASCVVGRR